MQGEELKNSGVPLERLSVGSIVHGLSSDGTAKIVQVEWFGDQARQEETRCDGQGKTYGQKHEERLHFFPPIGERLIRT